MVVTLPDRAVAAAAALLAASCVAVAAVCSVVSVVLSCPKVDVMLPWMLVMLPWTAVRAVEIAATLVCCASAEFTVNAPSPWPCWLFPLFTHAWMKYPPSIELEDKVKVQV